jgi:S1-C subfamily serine protease
MRTATAALAALVLLGGLAGRAAAAGFLGVSLAPADISDGVIIQDVVPDSPAAKAGLKAEDLIIKVDGKEFKNLQKFVEIIQGHKKGDMITLTLIRDGKPMEVKVALGEANP